MAIRQFGFRRHSDVEGDRFDADYLVKLYKKAGAKYFMVWACITITSIYGIQATLNSVGWALARTWSAVSKAARENGLRFGVSDQATIFQSATAAISRTVCRCPV